MYSRIARSVFVSADARMGGDARSEGKNRAISDRHAAQGDRVYSFLNTQ